MGIFDKVKDFKDAAGDVFDGVKGGVEAALEDGAAEKKAAKLAEAIALVRECSAVEGACLCCGHDTRAGKNVPEEG